MEKNPRAYLFAGFLLIVWVTGDRYQVTVFMSEIKNYRDLKVWQLAMQIAKEIHNLTEKFPKNNSYVLTQQFKNLLSRSFLI